MLRVSFLIFFLSFSVLEIIGQSFQLTIETNQQASVHGVYYWNNVLVKSQSFSTIATVSPNGNFVVHDLPAGKYTLLFSSRFHQSFSKSLTLKKNKTCKIHLFKKLKKTNSPNFIKKLKAGDTLYILHNASGFSVEKEELRFTVDQGKTVALLYNDNQFSQRVELTKEQIYLVTETEKKAVKLPGPSGCSVIESYTFQLNKKYFSVNDYTCNWNAFRRLVQNLFSN